MEPHRGVGGCETYFDVRILERALEKRCGALDAEAAKIERGRAAKRRIVRLKPVLDLIRNVGPNERARGRRESENEGGGEREPAHAINLAHAS